MGVDEINPYEFTGEKIKPFELNKKLDAGEDVILLDTRNEYEVRLGTFENAIDLNLDSFRDFPTKINGLREQIGDKEIVMFCTGGVRCEKASALMLKSGFKNVIFKQMKLVGSTGQITNLESQKIIQKFIGKMNYMKNLSVVKILYDSTQTLNWHYGTSSQLKNKTIDGIQMEHTNYLEMRISMIR